MQRVWVYANGAGNMETLAIDYSDSPLLENMLDHSDLYARYIGHVATWWTTCSTKPTCTPKSTPH